MTKSSDLNIMSKAADRAAGFILRDFGELDKLYVSGKGVKRFVQNTAKFAEQRIVYSLSNARPEYAFIDESDLSNQKDSTSYYWIINPIDGANNFMRGIPYFSLNIALMTNDNVIACYTLNPIRSDSYFAEKGQGAYFCSRKRLRVSGKQDLSESIVALYGSIHEFVKTYENQAIIRKTGSISLDLALLSAGKYDCVIAKNVQLKDFACGVLLVKEAGGFISYSKNEDNSYNVYAAASLKLFNKITKVP